MERAIAEGAVGPWRRAEEMRIRSLTMQNFRGFEDVTLDLDRPLTVLCGVNGSGKSSVLMACAVVLSEVFIQAHQFEHTQSWLHATDDTDVRRGTGKLVLRAILSNRTETREVGVAHPDPRRHESGIAVGLPLLHSVAPALAVLYETPRDVATAKDAFIPQSNENGVPALQPSSATYDALGVGRLKFRSLFQWFKAREDIENELKVSKQDLSLEDPQLAAVRRAIAGMLPGFSGLRIQRDPLHMVIRKGDTLLVLDQLSDGERLLLALTADLARRLAIAYADHSDPLQGEAVVLIDEIELHLHPDWQRRVLSDLGRTFPNCQLIVTTHSPQVLSEVPNDAVTLVQDFQFFRPRRRSSGLAPVSPPSPAGGSLGAA